MATSQPTETFAFYGDGAENTKATAKAMMTGLIVGGILSAALGAVILSWPAATLLVIAVLFGLFFLVRGIVRLVSGIFAPGLSTSGRVLSIIFGVILIIIGIFAMRNPGDSLAILGLLIGLSWIIDGIATLVESGRSSSRGFAIFAGIVSVVAGIVVLVVPIATVAVLTLIASIFLIVLAILQIVAAIVLGVKARKLKA